MRKPDFARNATWVVFRPQDFPNRVHVDLKGNKGFIDLTFSEASYETLEEIASCLLTDDMSVHQAGRSAVIRLRVSPLQVPDLGPNTESELREVFQNCSRLIALYRDHRSELDRVLGPGRQ
jgi:hypothetical protein